MTAIEIINLTKVFGEETILKNISCKFEQGKIHGIVGMNGSGKTVLLKCICGFIPPTEGKIYVEGKEIGQEIDFPESLGVIIENPGFLPELSGDRNLELLAAMKGQIEKSEIYRSMEMLGLDPKSKKKVKKYSLGMRERLGIAQAIMENPRILILDEPFNGLDKKGVKEVYQLIKNMKESGKTILLVSHNAADIESLCDFVYEMELGVLKKI